MQIWVSACFELSEERSRGDCHVSEAQETGTGRCPSGGPSHWDIELY